MQAEMAASFAKMEAKATARAEEEAEKAKDAEEQLKAKNAEEQRKAKTTATSGKEEGSRKRGREKGKGSKSTLPSAKAGLKFPVGRIKKLLQKGRYAKRIGAAAPVYFAAVLEFITADVLALAGNAAGDNKKSKITPRHIKLAVQNDKELGALCKGVIIPSGGVCPNIHPELLPKKSRKK